MPRSDAAKLIGENLHNLPAADGKPRRLLTFASAGHAPQMRDQITKRALDLGECIVHLLETHGYTIRHRDDPPPQDTPGQFPILEVNCAHCAEVVLRVAHLEADPHRPDRWNSRLHRSTLETMGHPHRCWE